MKKSRADTANTRRRIVGSALARFRRRGIERSGVAEIMADVGLSHGGFYRHFDSKEALVAEACADGLALAASNLDAAALRIPGGLEGILGRYLSREHCDTHDWGCPIAALGSELSRCDDTTRTTITEGVNRVVDLIAKQVDGDRVRALVVLSSMLGAVTLARIVSDPTMADTIIDETKKTLAK